MTHLTCLFSLLFPHHRLLSRSLPSPALFTHNPLHTLWSDLCLKRADNECLKLAAMVLSFILLATTILSVLFLLQVAFKLHKAQPWPPGPPAWPLIGHLHLLGDLPHQSLCSLSKIYGPLMGLRLGRVPVIIVSSPAMAKEILHTHDLTFASRPRLAAAVHINSNCTDMTFAPYGPYWKLLRQTFASALFSPKRLEESRHVRQEEVRALTRFLADTAGGKPLQEPMQLRESLLATSNNINCRMALGHRITEISNHGISKKGDLLSLVEEILHLLGVFYIGDFIPWMAWLDPHGYLKRMKATGRRAKEVMQAVIDERRENRKKALAAGEMVSQNDLLDALLHAATLPTDGVVITDDNIKAAILDVFGGGADTSSVAVEWAMADLINHPEVMEKVQEELDRVVGKARFVTEVDIPNLPYMGAVLKESMRLHPSVPLLVPREASHECYISGYRIPKKTLAYVNTWAIGRDPTVWERPLEFLPERFLTNNLDLRAQNFELLSFGAGRRGCPGLALGLINVHLLFASLVQGFRWSQVPFHPSKIDDHDLQPLDMSERFGIIVAMAKPLSLFLTPRLPMELY